MILTSINQVGLDHGLVEKVEIYGHLWLGGLLRSWLRLLFFNSDSTERFQCIAELISRLAISCLLGLLGLLCRLCLRLLCFLGFCCLPSFLSLPGFLCLLGFRCFLGFCCLLRFLGLPGFLCLLGFRC